MVMAIPHQSARLTPLENRVRPVPVSYTYIQNFSGANKFSGREQPPVKFVPIYSEVHITNTYLGPPLSIHIISGPHHPCLPNNNTHPTKCQCKL
jgi:hypothetical protein